MIRKIPSSDFLTTFSSAVTSRLVDSLSQAYADAVENHRPECGSSALTFGVDVYAFACKRLGGVAEEGETDVVLQCKGPSFRINIGGYELGCHKVGRSAQEDIWNSFPSNRGGIRTLVEAQGVLDFIKSEEVSGRKFVLAHLGNHEDGLCAVYVCQPKRLDSIGQVVEWEFVHELWKRDSGSERSGENFGGPLPAESVEDPVLRRKTQEEQENIHG